jgi:tetratricopeptide (TPR) repeat protein
MAVGAAALAALIIMAVNIDAVWYHMNSTFKEPSSAKSLALSDTTLGDRTILWRDTTRMITDYPAFGTGPGTWQWYHPQYQPKEMQGYAALAHNDILNLASDYGLIGFALIALALAGFYRHVSAFVDSRNTSDRRSFAIGSAVAVTIIIVHSWFDFNMHIPANALLLAALIGFTVAMEDVGGRYPRLELTRLWRTVLGFGLLMVLGLGGWHGGRTAIAYYHQTEGKRYKSNMNWRDALAAYERSISWDAKAPVPYARMGEIYQSQAFWRVDPTRSNERQDLARQAIKAYRRSLELNPRQTDVWLDLAKALNLAGERGAAEKAYLQAITLWPTLAYLRQELALFYRQHGDDEQALKQFELCLALGWNEVAALNLEELRPR